MISKYNFKGLLLALLVIAIGASSAFSQDWIGARNSNYAGITGVSLNPSSIAVSRYKLDVNIIGLDVSLQNNYVYYKNIYQAGKPDNGNDRTLKDYYTPDPLKNVFANIEFKGLGLMFSNKKNAFSFSFGNRLLVTGRDIPSHVAKIAYDKNSFGAAELLELNGVPNYHTTQKPFHIGLLSFAEVNLSYAINLVDNAKRTFALGVTGKYLLGTGGFYSQFNKFNYTLRKNDRNTRLEDMTVNDFDLDYAHSFSGDGSIIAGQGFGGDIGFTYIAKHNVGYKPLSKRGLAETYIYKFGVSLVDFGFIAYNKNSSVSQVSRSQARDGVVTWNGVDSVFDNLPISPSFDSLDIAIAQGVLGRPASDTRVADEFTMFLPTAASVQFDYSVNDLWYINAMAYIPVTKIKNGLQRPSVLSIGPRYENKYFEISFPYSLYDYNTHRFGLSVRLGSIILGSDRFGSFLGLTQMTGTDFYFAIKVSTFKFGNTYNPYACYFKNWFGFFSGDKKGKSSRKKPF